jgi:hypothetical protein
MKRYPLAKRLVCAALFLGLALQVQAAEKRVKVFILAGQSNMEGHGLVRSLDWLGQHPKYGHLPTKELNDEYLNRGGHWYCHYNGSASNYSLIGYALAEALNKAEN